MIVPKIYTKLNLLHLPATPVA